MKPIKAWCFVWFLIMCGGVLGMVAAAGIEAIMNVGDTASHIVAGSTGAFFILLVLVISVWPEIKQEQKEEE